MGREGWLWNQQVSGWSGGNNFGLEDWVVTIEVMSKKGEVWNEFWGMAGRVKGKYVT